jgi:hypothetical protein
MSSLYEKLQNKAYNLITSFGGSLQVVSRVTGEYDPISGEYTSSTTLVSESALVLPYNRGEGLIDNSLVTDDTIKVLCSGESVIGVSDEIIVGTTAYKVRSVRRLSPDSTTNIMTTIVASR